MILEVQLFDLEYYKEKEYTRVVCVSKYKGKYVFCYNKKRNGCEIPGGHIEEGETPTNLTYLDTFKLYFKTVKDKKGF